MKRVAFSAETKANMQVFITFLTSFLLSILLFNFALADDFIPLTLDYSAETYAYAFAFEIIGNIYDEETDNDSTSNSLCQSEAIAWALFWEIGPGPMPDFYSEATSHCNVRTEGYVNSGTVTLTSTIEGHGTWYRDIDGQASSGYGGGDGNGTTSLQGTLAIGQFPGYPSGTPGLVLQITAQVDGNVSNEWTSHAWQFKIWETDPNAPLAVIDQNDFSAEIKVSSGKTLNIEFYQAGAEDEWPESQSGLSTTVNVSLNLILAPSLADMDDDMFVNFFDFAILADGWLLSPDPCDPNNGDITKNSQVDIYDLAHLTKYWLTCFVTGAVNPEPVDCANDVSVNVILQWSPGENAVWHDVYFGTDFNEVNDADFTNPTVYMGNQDVNYWDTNNSQASLNYNTIYYWRIDEAATGCSAKGDVWSFTTVPPLPGQANNPTPPNAATNVGLTQDLSWTAGSFAASHDVYFGTVSPPPFIVNQTNTTFDTGTMNADTIYYWRIDEKNPCGTTVGTEWSFTIIPGEVNEANLAAWWKMDETDGTIAYDSAGENDGNLVNGPVWTSGKIAGGLNFDGTDDYVDANGNPSLRFDQNDSFSISLWAYPVSKTGLVTLVGKMGTSQDLNDTCFGYRISWEYPLGRRFIFKIHKTAQISTNIVTPTGSAMPDNWYHVVCVYENRNMSIYLNGQLSNSGTFTGGTGDTTPDKNLSIGAFSWGNTLSGYFKGILDDILIYNRVLTADEVTLLYWQGE